MIFQINWWINLSVPPSDQGHDNFCHSGKYAPATNIIENDLDWENSVAFGEAILEDMHNSFFFI